MRTLVLGAGGQVGRALVAALPDADAFDRGRLDVTAPDGVDWAGYQVVINAAAFTDVDGAETPDGRRSAWRINAGGPAALAALARDHGVTLVHLSTEYVFDGHDDAPYVEGAPVAPLSAYGASKAAGDVAVTGLDAHYLVRPTWVVGDGRNFVATMLGLAGRGVAPTVVADQIGRLTFADDLAAAIRTLLRERAPFGAYHVTGGGEPGSWADVAREVFALAGRDRRAVTDTSTEAYFADKPGAAVRPRNSVLDLSKARDVGITPPDWRESLARHLSDRA